MTGLEYTPPAGIPRVDFDWNGFVDRSATTLTFTDGSRTLSIQPTGATFQYFCMGKKHTTTGDTVVIDDAEGIHLIYYDGSTLTSEDNPTGADMSSAIRTKCFVAIVYWDTSAVEGIYVGDERHGYIMPTATHNYEHFENGLVYRTGLGLNTIDADQTGNDNAHAQFGVDAGSVADEDLYLTISAIVSTTGLPIYHLTGAGSDANRTVNAGFSVRTFDNTSSTRLAWNELTGGAWQLSEAANNSFVNYHVFASTEKDKPMISVMGQASYQTKPAAQSGAETEVLSIITNQILSPELRPIATVIFKTANAMLNDVNAAIQLTADNEKFRDWRHETISRVAVSTTDHNSLSGKQGGTAGEFYHTTSAQHTAVTDEGGVDNADAQHEHAHNSTTGLNDGDYKHLTEARHNTLTNADTTIENADLQHTHDHNVISGKQGGSSGQYYHMTSTQHTRLTSSAGVEDADLEHSHDGISENTAARHAEDHTITSHTDVVDATGAQLETLTGGGETALHSHAAGGGDVVGPGSAVDENVCVFDTTTGKLIKDSLVTKAELDDLTDGGDTTLHDHDGIAENTAARSASYITQTAEAGLSGSFTMFPVPPMISNISAVPGTYLLGPDLSSVSELASPVTTDVIYVMDESGSTSGLPSNWYMELGSLPLDDTVSTAKIQADAVTNAELANMAAATVKGNATGGSANPTDLTMATLRAMLVETYYDQSFANPLVTDADNGFKFDVELSGDSTINVPSNLTEGMLIEFRFRQDSAGGHTITWHADYNDGELTDTSVDETAYAITYVLCKYNDIATEMDIVAVNRGYPSS